ncbi:hypothetical protein ABZU76_02995 [Amycolatopsis sp. NPDC005232]|uniref:hypothetical protein n=1 Tax=Amycolatopsis sp. NPDC005232 TaxID=3157027 RepID=UPI0033BD5BD0
MMAVPFLPEIPGSQIRVEIAWGADMTDYNGFSWVWADVTTDVLFDEKISVTLGRNDEASTSGPTTISLKLDNSTNAYSLGGISPNYPNVRRNVPVRVSVDLNDLNGFRVVAQGYADGFSPEWRDDVGRIPLAGLSASGLLRRLLQGSDPLRSALYRFHTVGSFTKPVEYWPLEEDKTASAGISDTGGLPALVKPGDIGGVNYGKVKWGGDTDNVATERAVQVSAGASMYCPVRTSLFPDGTQTYWAVSWIMRYTSISGAKFFLTTQGQNALTIYAIFYTDGTVEVYSSQPAGDTLQMSYTQGDFTGWDDVWHSWTLTVDQSVTNTQWNLLRDGQLVALKISAVLPRGVPSQIRFDSLPDPGNAEDPVTLGHVAFWNSPIVWNGDYAEAIVAYSGENAALRLLRLGIEQGFNVNVVGTVGVQMGPQRPVSVVDLLRECEAVDQGVLLDGLDAGLTYITRGERENAAVDLALDATELYPPFQPTDDDQRNRNRVTASVTGASSKTTFEDTDGPLGTDAIGVYDSSSEVNLFVLDDVVNYASWAVHLGTVEGYRYPTLAVNLRAAPARAFEVLQVRPSTHVSVSNVSDVIAGLPDDTVDLLVEGMEHSLSPREWIFTAKCSPAAPWTIATIADETGDTDDDLMRLQTDGARIPLPSLVGAGPGTSANNASLTPTLPAGGRAGDLILVLASIRNSGTGTPNTPTGYTLVQGPSTPANMRLFYKVHTGTESNPTVSFTGGATNATTVAQAAIFRNVGAPQLYSEQLNASAQNIAWPGVAHYDSPALVMALGWKADDWTTVDPVATEIGEPVGTAGDDAGIVWDYIVAGPGQGGSVLPAVFPVNGGAAAISRGAIVVFDAVPGTVGTTSLKVETPSGPLWTTAADDFPLYLSVGGLKVRATACSAATGTQQTFTIDALPVGKPAGTAVEVWDPPVLGL